jgi:hypothetical protein
LGIQKSQKVGDFERRQLQLFILTNEERSLKIAEFYVLDTALQARDFSPEEKSVSK